MIRNIDLNVDSLCEMPTFFQKNNEQVTVKNNIF